MARCLRCGAGNEWIDGKAAPQQNVGSSDELERAADHLRTMAPHIRERLTAQLLQQVLARALELETKATCECGDGFTVDDPGKCINCVMMSSNEKLRGAP